MRLIDSPVVQGRADELSPEDRKVFLDTIRYEGVYDELATNMRILLRVQGKTQCDVAERMGTSESALSRLLHGKAVRKAKLETLVRFAKAIELDPLDLFGDLGTKPSLAPAVVVDAPAVPAKRSITVWRANVAYPQQYHSQQVTWGGQPALIVRSSFAT